MAVAFLIIVAGNKVRWGIIEGSSVGQKTSFWQLLIETHQILSAVCFYIKAL